MNRTIAPYALKNTLADRYILDVRRASDRDASDEQLPSAHWHDPDKLTEWVNCPRIRTSFCIVCAAVRYPAALSMPRRPGASERTSSRAESQAGKQRVDRLSRNKEGGT